MFELIQMLLRMFTMTQQARAARSVSVPIEVPVKSEVVPKKETKVEINWSDPKAKISKYFTAGEALFLPSWNCYHIPNDEEKAALLKFTAQMDIVREYLGKPIKVHCLLRPSKVNCPSFDPKSIVIAAGDPKKEIKKAALAAMDYNTFIGGAKRSAHRVAQAMDFSCGEDCNETRKKLLPKLVEWNMRMEDHQGPWVHLDTYPASVSGGQRFFKI